MVDSGGALKSHQCEMKLPCRPHEEHAECH